MVNRLSLKFKLNSTCSALSKTNIIYYYMPSELKGPPVSSVYKTDRHDMT